MLLLKQVGPVALRAQDIRKSFGGAAVLQGISFELGRQEILGVVGPSGGGKTTLLRCLDLLDIPDQGSIEYPGITRFSTHLEDGKAPSKDWSRAEILQASIALRRKVGIVFQNLNLWEEKTVLQNLTLAPRVVLGRLRDAAEAEAIGLCRQFGLADKVRSRVWALSGGEKQRVAILRALLMAPEILLLDEITSALDPILTVSVMETIQELRGRGLAMVLVTHHIEFASSLCDRLMFLDEGRAIQIDRPALLKSNPANERVRAFLKVLETAR